MQCISTRENILFCIDVIRSNAEKALDILADTVLFPTFPEDELEESRMIARLQPEELPDDVFSKDLVQRAAYLNQPLGNHHFCPDEHLDSVSAKTLHDFRAKHFFGENCVLAVTGVDHKTIIPLIEKKFSSLPKGRRSNIIRKKSAFTGGLMQHERNLKEPFVRIALTFEAGGWNDDQLVATCVLQHLLGGGSSFSSGGPGKGMYTRLYTQVLNCYRWAESVEAFVSVHEDNGIFGIDSSCPPENIPHMIREIIDQLAVLAFVPVSPVELSRAKNMLKSFMMMQLESRLVLCEDIARQYITYDKREDPVEVCSKIDKITANDLMAVGKRLLLQPPAIGIVGSDLSHVPAYDDIVKFANSYREEMAKSYKANQ